MDLTGAVASSAVDCLEASVNNGLNGAAEVAGAAVVVLAGVEAPVNKD